MQSSRSRTPGTHGSRTVGALLLLASLVAFSCGGSGSRNAAPTNAGTGSTAGSGSAGATSAGGESGAGTGGNKGVGAGSHSGAGTGGGPGGGSQAVGGSEAVGGAAGGAGEGAGGASEGTPGIPCDDATCAIGQACVHCVTEEANEHICVPHPLSDPNGYAAATAACAAEPGSPFDDCDGPEDCEAGQFCVARASADAFMRCRDLPSSEHSCCFTCGALPDCTICRSDPDCPAGETCSRDIGDGLRGCVP